MLGNLYFKAVLKLGQWIYPNPKPIENMPYYSYGDDYNPLFVHRLVGCFTDFDSSQLDYFESNDQYIFKLNDVDRKLYIFKKDPKLRFYKAMGLFRGI